MAQSNARAVFEAWLQAVNSQDVGAVDALVHPDYEEVWPQSGERIRGVANLKAILEHYPGGYTDQGRDRVVSAEDRWVVTPMYTLLRIEGTGSVCQGTAGLPPGRTADLHLRGHVISTPADSGSLVVVS